MKLSFVFKNSQECEKSLDHKEECEILSSKKFIFDGANFTEKTNKLDFIAPLRLLLKIKQNPKLDVFLKYDTKNEARKKRNDEKYGPGSDKEIVQVILETLKLGFRSQSFTSLMADLRQDINRVSSFSRCLNGTFP